MHRLKKFALGLIGLFLLAGLIAILAWGISTFFSYLASIPKELAAPLIAASSTILVATLTVMIGRYYERKRELE